MVGVVVAAQQTIDLHIDEDVVRQAPNPFLRRARRSATGGTTDVFLAPTARVRLEARHAETVAAHQDLGTNPESVVAQPATEEFFGRLLWLVFPAMILRNHVRIRNRRHRLTLTRTCLFLVNLYTFVRQKTDLIGNQIYACDVSHQHQYNYVTDALLW